MEEQKSEIIEYLQNKFSSGMTKIQYPEPRFKKRSTENVQLNGAIQELQEQKKKKTK